MNVYQSIEDIQSNHCFLCRPIPNKFLNYNYFYKISYNLLSFTLNSILIWIDLKSYQIKEINDQFMVNFTIDDAFLDKVIRFEHQLLESFNLTIHKKIHYPCYDSKNVFYYKHKVDAFRLYFRISGIWESDTHIGLTSKLDMYPSDSYPST
jgi:hypothetical protein